MFVIWQHLSKDVHNLIIHRDVLKGDIAILNSFTYEMVANTDVFHLCVKGRIGCECNGTLVINKESCRIRKGEPDVS